MIRAVIAAAAFLFAAQGASAQAAPEPIQVMVLGSWHFDNPGRDLHNVQVDPVTTPDKQAQLAAVAQALARFQPTAVAIERVAPDQSTFVDQGWTAFTPDALLTNPDERVQIGYRLADLADVSRVYAIDEQAAEGEDVVYFPYGAVAEWAGANGRSGDLQAMQGPVAAYAAEMETLQRTQTIGALLADINRPDHPVNGTPGQGLYYGFLQFGAGRELPGAVLNARWYERNAKIFTKLLQVAEPGDRVVVVFGAGHGYWLRHFVETTPGFELAPVGDYLGGL